MTQSSLKDKRRLYGDLAWTWPTISALEFVVQPPRPPHLLPLPSSLPFALATRSTASRWLRR